MPTMRKILQNSNIYNLKLKTTNMNSKNGREIFKINLKKTTKTPNIS